MKDEKIGFMNMSAFSICSLDYQDFFLNVQMEFASRSLVEKDDTKLQIIPILSLFSEDGRNILAVRKASGACSEESGRLLGYIGGHINMEDKRENFLQTVKVALSREVFEEIGQSLSFEVNRPFLIHDSSTPQSRRHLAVCFCKRVNLAQMEIKLDQQEFKSVEIISVTRLMQERIEPWTRTILQKILASSGCFRPEILALQSCTL